ncbi:MAG: Ig-like domain-containing protein [Defluviitaleaceae bacterium]|nr:Ig-like domain-containing protein [Defluviitaleaceae bacterium]
MKKNKLLFRLLIMMLVIGVIIPTLTTPLSTSAVELNASATDLNESEELNATLDELEEVLEALDALLDELSEQEVEKGSDELDVILNELTELDATLKELSESETTPRRAIYLLPGYSITKLYSQRFRGIPIWLGPGIVTDIGLHLLGGRLGRQSELVNNEDGTGMTAFVDRSRDRMGSLPLYLPMMVSIRAALIRHGLNDVYTLEFFPFNFVGDLNDAARELADDIDEKGYESVVLIGHSNGGLLASAFVAQSEDNRNLVESAVLLAAPLWGSYLGLEMIETGGFTLFDGTFYMTLINAFYNIFLRPISRSWMRDWARNSPNSYQLIPGPEYISRIPFLYRTAEGTRGVTDMDEFYGILNRSPNMNSNLVDGNERSSRYFRETVFNGDVLDVWEGINVTLVGSEYGRLTPITVVYEQHGDEAIFAGNIFSRAGDGLVIGASLNGDGRFDFVNLPTTVGHVLLAMEPRALRTINDVILGRPLFFANDETDSPATSDVGMSDMIRVEIRSSDPLMSVRRNTGIRVHVYDEAGVLVAEATGDTQRGFWDHDFIYSTWSNHQYETNILLYIPKEGYTLEVFTGHANPQASHISLSTHTLSQSGAILSRHVYELIGANNSTRSIFTLQGHYSMTPTNEPHVQLDLISTESFQQDWSFTSTTFDLENGTSFTPEIVGSDAAHVNMSDYDWHSSHPDVASVSDTGVITGNSAGTTTITAISRDDSLKIEIISVTVYEDPIE